MQVVLIIDHLLIVSMCKIKVFTSVSALKNIFWVARSL